MLTPSMKAYIDLADSKQVSAAVIILTLYLDWRLTPSEVGFCLAQWIEEGRDNGT